MLSILGFDNINGERTIYGQTEFYKASKAQGTD